MKTFLIHIRNWVFTSLIVASVMGAVMTLFIIVSDEATFEEITLGDVKYGLGLSFISSALFWYPIFGSIIRYSRTTPNPETTEEDVKRDMTNNWNELLKTSLKWGLVLFILITVTSYLTQGNFDILFSLQYGFGGGVLAALIMRTLSNSFLNSQEPLISDNQEQSDRVNRPILFNWIVATISSMFLFLMVTFLIHFNLHDTYTKSLETKYLPIAIGLGIAYGQWVRIRNNKF